MNPVFWTFVVTPGGVVSVSGIVGLTLMGRRAHYTGAAPGLPEAFTAFASQVLRIATVIAIVGTTLTIVLQLR